MDSNLQLLTEQGIKDEYDKIVKESGEGLNKKDKKKIKKRLKRKQKKILRMLNNNEGSDGEADNEVDAEAEGENSGDQYTEGMYIDGRVGNVNGVRGNEMTTTGGTTVNRSDCDKENGVGDRNEAKNRNKAVEKVKGCRFIGGDEKNPAHGQQSNTSEVLNNISTKKGGNQGNLANPNSVNGGVGNTTKNRIDLSGEFNIDKIQEKELNMNNKNNEDNEGIIRGPKLPENFRVKQADLGNACWVHHHFQPEIQTRQYRSPEVILGINYNSNADIWSFACMIFEMLTGDFQFEPRKGANYSKSDDHQAQMIELLKKFPRKYSTIGTHWRKYFDRRGNLKKITEFKYWPLNEVQIQKYKIKETEANAFTDFMLPMLNYFGEKRATAQKMLEKYWLKMPPRSDYIMSKKEAAIYCTLQRDSTHNNSFFLNFEADDIENYDADVDDNDLEDELQSDSSGDYEEYYEGHRLMDRSFRNVYTGYSDGIDIDHQDHTNFWIQQKTRRKYKKTN